MISLGQGGYNPSLQAFGADQLENESELPRTNNINAEKKGLFFQWWYFGVCCGSLVGVSAMSYIQDTFGWGLGFAIPSLSMVASILMFLCGNSFYVRQDPRSLVRAIKATFNRIINGNGNGSMDTKVHELE